MISLSRAARRVIEEADELARVARALVMGWPGGVTEYKGARPPRRASPRAVALLHAFESCRLTAYLCPARVWTIGWGATGDDIVPGLRWTRAMADARFRADLGRFERAVDALLGDAPTTRSQFDALVCFAFNAGAGGDGLGGSTLLRRHRAGAFEAAAGQFGRWVFGGGKRLNGLVRRRGVEAALYRGEVAAVDSAIGFKAVS